MPTTEQLVLEYNSLRLKAIKIPKKVRYNAMPTITTNLRLRLDELQRRAMLGDNLLHKLNH